MREQTIGQANRRLPLLGLAGAERAAIEHASLEVDVPAANRRHESGAADRARPATGVETDQDKAREMAAHRAIGTAILHDLLCSPRRTNQVRGLIPSQPDISALRFLWQHHRHDLGAKPLSSVVIDRSAKVLKLTPCGSLSDESRFVAGLFRFR